MKLSKRWEWTKRDHFSSSFPSPLLTHLNQGIMCQWILKFRDNKHPSTYNYWPPKYVLLQNIHQRQIMRPITCQFAFMKLKTTFGHSGNPVKQFLDRCINFFKDIRINAKTRNVFSVFVERIQQIKTVFMIYLELKIGRVIITGWAHWFWTQVSGKKILSR